MEEDQLFRDLGQPHANRERLESHLEELFVQGLDKYLNPNSEILPQYEVQTILGKYRLDFVVSLGGHKIGFECDGKDYHDDFRDEWRDALILHSKEIDTMYRFRGKDIFSFLDDCIYIIYKHDAFIFNNRYEHHYELLVSPDTLSYFISDESNFKEHENTFIEIETKDEYGKVVGIMRLRTIRRGQNTDGHWKDLVAYTLANPGLSLDQLIKLRVGKPIDKL